MVSVHRVDIRKCVHCVTEDKCYNDDIEYIYLTHTVRNLFSTMQYILYVVSCACSCMIDGIW